MNARRRALFGSLLGTLTAVSCAFAQSPAYSFYLPQVADGPAGNGTFKTSIVLANPGKSSMTVTIAATRNDSSPMRLTIAGLGSNGPFSTTLGAGATRVFSTDGSGDGSAGAVTVGASAPLNVSGVVTLTDLTGNVLSESGEIGIGSMDLIGEYLVPVDTTNGLNSGVALFNPGTAAATVKLRLLGAGGPAGVVTLTLPAKGHATRFAQGDLFPGLGEFRGTMDVESTANIAATVVRRNAASPGYTLLPAGRKTSRGMRFFFPQISEGTTAAGTQHTTLIVTNVSAQPAFVSVNLTADDGSPWAAIPPGRGCVPQSEPLQSALPGSRRCLADYKAAGPASVAQFFLLPRETVFWQTEGGAALKTGAAVVRSRRPVAVAGVVTSFGPSGAVLTETGLSAATPDFQFVAPFQSDTFTAAGAAFFNSGHRSVTMTLSLVDPDGKSLAASKSVVLAAGARTAGMVADFFQGATAASGAIAATTGNPVDSTVSATVLREKATGGIVSLPPAVGLPMAAGGSTPATVAPTLDTTRQASASIPPSGGSLTVTDAKGNRFTLTIPPNALLNRETITMTAISSATGVSGSGLLAGVQLEPDGLGLLQPALLKIDLASPAPKGTVPFGWRNQVPGVYLNMLLPDPNSLTLSLMHFSGAGAGGLDVTSDLINIANQLDLIQSVIAALEAQARQEELLGDSEDAAIDGARAYDAFDLGYDTVVEPLMELAQGTDDEDILRCAAQQAMGYSRQLQLLGQEDDPHEGEIESFLSYAFSRAAQKIGDRCQKHDPTAYFDAIGVMRQSALLGGDSNIDISACPPAFELDYNSEIMGDVSIGVTGTFDSVISGKVPLPGELSKTSLTAVVDPSKDLYTSFELNGSAAELYNIYTISIPPDAKSGCVETPAPTVPDTMTVKPGSDPQLSQVQYKFNPHYDPQAVTANGQQLCSFCPVYRTTPVKVELWMDPGKPAEGVVSTCKGGAMTIATNFWWTGWIVNHATAGDNGFITGWDLVNQSNLMAQKTISTTVSQSGITLTEKTDLKLKPFGQ